MAESTVNQLIISNAGTSSFNDTYTKQEGTINGFSYWIGDTNGYYIAAVQSGPPNNYVWIVTDDVELPIGFQNGYNFYVLFPIVLPAIDQPPEGVSTQALGTATGTATISWGAAAPTQPTFGLPADVVALITSRFGSVANFLRLRNQGQV